MIASHLLVEFLVVAVAAAAVVVKVVVVVVVVVVKIVDVVVEGEQRVVQQCLELVGGAVGVVELECWHFGLHNCDSGRRRISKGVD